MGFPAAVIGTMVMCPMVTPALPPIPHVGGPINKGAPTVLICNMPAARISDTNVCVGPPGVVMKGSATVLTCSMPQARMLDTAGHGGMITIAGAIPNVLVGG